MPNNYQRQKLLSKDNPTFVLICQKCGQGRTLGDTPQWIDIKAFYTLHQKFPVRNFLGNKLDNMRGDSRGV